MGSLAGWRNTSPLGVRGVVGGVRRGYLSTPLNGKRLTQTFDFSGPAGVAAGDVLIQSVFKMCEMCDSSTKCEKHFNERLVINLVSEITTHLNFCNIEKSTRLFCQFICDCHA